MPTPAPAQSFADLAQRYGSELAYIARQGNGNTVPADPSAATPDEFLQLARDAHAFLDQCRYDNWAEAMEDAADAVAAARQADGADELAILLRRADKELRPLTYDAACEVADALGDPHDF
ncbi:hypothetical protein ACFV1L_22045 [Kitasatospora sp. NPDC059646]|uniref:hypothetical protein n=1 Tax=Kitasatospora sp. NPDC059646 TaxID=3346893 RepID=UPI0036C8ECEE